MLTFTVHCTVIVSYTVDVRMSIMSILVGLGPGPGMGRDGTGGPTVAVRIPDC